MRLLLIAYPSAAYAHPAPAEPPVFDASPCVQVVDKSTTQSLDISYAVLADDTMVGPGDIVLSDARTHQFFAIAGAVQRTATGYRVFPFAPEVAQEIELPLWITRDDVERAAQANSEASGVQFTSADVPPGTVLADHPVLGNRFERITADDARLPIRVTHGWRAVHWSLSSVPAGLYIIAAYVFSPPYNDWAVRDGLVKVVEPGRDLPAGDIDSISDSTFSYQGRRVSACLDVPDGTLLNAYYRAEDEPPAAWQGWFQGRPVRTGMLELCFHADEPNLTGSIRLRFELVAPDGNRSVLHSRDTLTWLRGAGTCTETPTHCCAFSLGTRDAGLDIVPPSMESAGAAAISVPARRPAATNCSALDAPQRASVSLVPLLFILSVAIARARRSARAMSINTQS